MKTTATRAAFNDLRLGGLRKAFWRAGITRIGGRRVLALKDNGGYKVYPGALDVAKLLLFSSLTRRLRQARLATLAAGRRTISAVDVQNVARMNGELLYGRPIVAKPVSRKVKAARKEKSMATRAKNIAIKAKALAEDPVAST